MPYILPTQESQQPASPTPPSSWWAREEAAQAAAAGTAWGAAGATAGAATADAAPTSSTPASSAATGPDAPPAPEPRPKRYVGLGTAAAMVLVASLGAGLLGGVIGASTVPSSSQSSALPDRVGTPGGSDDRGIASNLNTTGHPPAEGSIEHVAAAVLPAVVSIQVASQTSASEGSGSIISPDGLVMTNHHVVAGAADGAVIQVTMNDGSKHPADFIASDVNTDVAVIKIRDINDAPFLNFGDSDALRVGQEVVAVGSPLGLNATVTSGIVSAKNRPVRASQGGGESSLVDAIQTDAAVNPGNSGGPLVDMNGNLVGMNSMIASLSAGGREAGSIGLGFAIPSNFAHRMANQLIAHGAVVHPLLGVQVDGRNPVDGAVIVAVEPGSPADNAGVQPGDVVVRVGDRLIESSDALIAAIRSQEFGSTVTLNIIRGDGANGGLVGGGEGNSEEITVEVQLPAE